MEIYKPLRIYDSERTICIEFDRNSYLSRLASGKKVLHVGCSDYPVTLEKLHAGDLLHKQLQENAEELLGIDISEEGLNILRSAGIHSVIYMDAEEMTMLDQYDLIMAGDMLEHLNNPGRFLAGARRLLRDGGELVVAVPNAFSANAIKLWWAKREDTHQDHTFYFTPKTLATLCARYGLAPVRLRYTVQPKSPYESRFFESLRRIILKRCLNMSPAFIMHFRKENDVEKEIFWIYQ